MTELTVEPRLLVTHYASEAPHNGVWIPLAFLTRQAGNPDRYYFGFDVERPIPAADVEKRTAAGDLRALDRPHQIAADQRLWLTADGDVWLAKASAPASDATRVLVDPGHLRRLLLNGRPYESEVVAHVIAEKKLKYLYGDYCNSRDNPFVSYEPRWQARLLDKLRDRISNSSGLPIVLEKLPHQEHRYYSVATLIRSGEVAVCLEMLLLDQDRENADMRIVPLGHVTHYALVWADNGYVGARLGDGIDDGDVWYRQQTWFDCIRHTPTRVCAHIGTVAEDELVHAIFRGQLNNSQKTEEATVQKLGSWLKDNASDGMIVCDVGVMWQLRAAQIDRSVGLRHVLVPYRNPIPLGIAYLGKDPAWGALLTQTLQELAESSDPQVLESFEDTQRLFVDLAATWVHPLGRAESVAV